MQIKNPTAVEKAEQALRKLMISGKIQQGQRLVESRLARQVGLSRTAIREALNRLKNSGLVRYIPYCGYQVRVFELRDYLELYELREAIEPIAARNAAELQNLSEIQAIREAHMAEITASQAEDADDNEANQADRDFHQAIIQACGNRRFLDIFRNYYCSDLLFTYHSFHSQDPLNTDLREVNRISHQATNEAHEKILLAIEQGNGLEAQSLMARHMAEAKDAFLRYKMPLLARKNIPVRSLVQAG